MKQSENGLRRYLIIPQICLELIGRFYCLVTLQLGYFGFSRFGKVRLGKMDKPKYSYYRWVAMILVTLLASGGVFWAAAEPMYHYMTTPPLLAVGSLTIYQLLLRRHLCIGDFSPGQFWGHCLPL